jgi:hypothetical protein
MRRFISGWAESASAVGGALLRVWKAEVEALKRDLSRSGTELRAGVVLLALAGGIAFWTIGLGLWAVVEALAGYLPRWGAAAVVCGAGLLATAALFLLGRRRLRRVESPLRLVKRHGREHAQWWQMTMMPESGRDGPGAGSSERSTGESARTPGEDLDADID